MSAEPQHLQALAIVVAQQSRSPNAGSLLWVGAIVAAVRRKYVIGGTTDHTTTPQPISESLQAVSSPPEMRGLSIDNKGYQESEQVEHNPVEAHSPRVIAVRRGVRLSGSSRGHLPARTERTCPAAVLPRPPTRRVVSTTHPRPTPRGGLRADADACHRDRTRGGHNHHAGAVALAVARNAGDWAAAFVIAFGAWDITFYVVLKVLLDWPASLFTWDILFLIPVPWVGPSGTGAGFRPR